MKFPDTKNNNNSQSVREQEDEELWKKVPGEKKRAGGWKTGKLSDMFDHYHK